MKQMAVIAVTCLVGLALAAGCGSSGTETYTKSQTNITTGVGEQFIIKLESNATTGYQWAITGSLDPKVVKKVKSVYIAPKTSGNIAGAGGVEEWTFQGVAKGTAVIKMGYLRSFEKNVPPIQSVSFNVTVQ
jgi:predicted secreted protein